MTPAARQAKRRDQFRRMREALQRIIDAHGGASFGGPEWVERTARDALADPAGE